MKRELMIAAMLAGPTASLERGEAAVLEVPGKYPTITLACAAAVAADTVAVYPGTYNEGGINVPAGVTVLGMGSDSTDVKVCPPPGQSQPCFSVWWGEDLVVLENMELHGYDDYMFIVGTCGDSLLIQRCHLVHHGYPQMAPVVRAYFGSTTVRRSHVEFVGWAVYQWVFEAHPPGPCHLVVEDCIIQTLWDYTALCRWPPAGTVFEFTNNTILCRFRCSVDNQYDDCSVFVVNNIIESVVCGSSPAYLPDTLEWRYNCVIDGSLAPECGYQIGNFVADPLFCDSTAADYRLQPGSPCIGSGEGGENVGARLGVCWPTEVGRNPAGREPDMRISGPWPNPTTGGVVLFLRGGARFPHGARVLDVCGNVVSAARVTHAGEMAARVQWDGRSALGRPVPAGVYYLHVPANGRGSVARFVVVR